MAQVAIPFFLLGAEGVRQGPCEETPTKRMVVSPRSPKSSRHDSASIGPGSPFANGIRKPNFRVVDRLLGFGVPWFFPLEFLGNQRQLLFFALFFVFRGAPQTSAGVATKVVVHKEVTAVEDVWRFSKACGRLFAGDTFLNTSLPKFARNGGGADSREVGKRILTDLCVS